MKKRTFDFAVAFFLIGTGVVGMNIARKLGKEFPKCSILIFDKDAKVGQNASSRNSGVLHSGFYYKAGTMKGRMSQIGNQRWTEYCKEFNLPFENTGKLCVPRNDNDEKSVIPQFLSQASANKCPIEIVDPQQAREIEPRVHISPGVSKILWSPTSSIASPVQIINHLADLTVQENNNAIVELNCKFEGIEQKDGVNHIKLLKNSNEEHIEAKYFINATGTHADRIARKLGFSKDYTAFPVRGYYLRHNEFKRECKTLVYPGCYEITDLIHTTPVTDGYMKIGPCILPSLTRDSPCESWPSALSQGLELTSTWARAVLSKNGLHYIRLGLKAFQQLSQKRAISRMNTIWTVPNGNDYTTWIQSMHFCFSCFVQLSSAFALYK